MDAAEMTLPEFVQALNAMGYVNEELRPKSAEEIVGMMAAARAAEAARRKLSKETGL